MDAETRIRDALSYIPPTDRDVWVRCGMALKSECGERGFPLWDDWSRSGDSYNQRDARDVWRSIEVDGPIKIGSLFHLAAQHGWRGKNGSRHPAAEAEQDRTTRTDIAANMAQRIWDAATADRASEHAYLCDKGVRAHDVRIGTWTRRTHEGDARYPGALIVPLRDIEGRLCSLQAIFARDPGIGRTKDFIAGGRKSGCMHVLGTLEGAETICIAEGYATAASVHEATGCPTVMAVDATNLMAVAKALRAKLPSATLILYADDDYQTKGNPGITKATEAARAIGGLLAVPDFGADRPEGATDFNDLARVRGLDAVRRAIEGAKAPEKPQRYRLLTADDLLRMPRPEWLVDGLLPCKGVAALYGASTAGKSFVSLDLANAIAHGATWFGMRVQQAPLVYVALEGEGGFPLRVEALQIRHRRPVPVRFVMYQQFALTNPDDIEGLAGAIVDELGLGAVVIIDTLNCAAPGLDEISGKEVGSLIEACKELYRRIGGLVILVGHTGKDEARGWRIHSSAFAALDAAIEVYRQTDTKGRPVKDSPRFWRAPKVKDGKEMEPRAFELRITEIGDIENGESVTSCVVEPVDAPDEPAQQRPGYPRGSNQRIVWEAIGPLLRKGQMGIAGAPPGRPCIRFMDAVEALAEKIPGDDQRRQKARTREAITALVSQGFLGHEGGWIWDSK